MSARQALGGDVFTAFAPRGANVEQLVHDAVAAPEDERRAGDFPVEIRRVVLEIDAGGGAIVRSGAVDQAGVAPAAAIFGDELGVEISKLGRAPSDQAGFIKEVRIGR